MAVVYGLNSRLISRLVLAAIMVAAFSLSTFADTPRERVQFGHDVSIAPGEHVGEVTCFGCRVRVRGQVDGDVTTFGGSVVVEDQGQISGDASVFGGNIRLEGGTKVAGDVAIFGGHLQRDASSTVGGDVTSFTGWWWLVLMFGMPFFFLGGLIVLVVWLVRRLTRPRVPVAA